MVMVYISTRRLSEQGSARANLVKLCRSIALLDSFSSRDTTLVDFRSRFGRLVVSSAYPGKYPRVLHPIFQAILKHVLGVRKLYILPVLPELCIAFNYIPPSNNKWMRPTPIAFSRKVDRSSLQAVTQSAATNKNLSIAQSSSRGI